MNLQLNDPSVPAPGEMFQEPIRASPQPIAGATLPPDASRHHRTPSLGELHQELEAEQEGHVVRNPTRLIEIPLVNKQANLLPFAESTAKHDPATTAGASAPSSKPPASSSCRRSCRKLRESTPIAPRSHQHPVSNRQPHPVSVQLLLFPIANLPPPSKLHGDGPRRHAAPVQDAEQKRLPSLAGDFYQRRERGLVSVP